MFDKFSDRHIGVTRENELKAMLDTIGVGSVEELIAQVIPQSIRLKKPLALPAQGMSEYEFSAHIRALADLGVDFISSGALTHSAPILDLSLKHLRMLDGA